MEHLPYIDEHATVVGGTPDEVWGGLVRSLRATMGARAPALFEAVWALQPSRASDGWRGETAPGATLPGFEVADARAPELLALAGRHRFSRYRLVFELDEVEPGRTRVRASTWAAFPGLAGHVYRALVIGTRGHRLAVRRILGRIRPGTAPGLSG